MKTPNSFFSPYFSELSSKIKDVDANDLESAAGIFLRAHDEKQKLIFVGNGGSASIASHLSIDASNAAGIRAINFNDPGLITCFSNDYGYEHWVEHALEAYADQGDVAVMISSSGCSPNIINGARMARKMGLPLITLSGFNSDNPLRKLGNLNFWCNSKSYNVVELTHQVWMLSIIDFIIHSST